MTKHIFAILITIIAVIPAFAQEMLIMPAYNPAVAKQYYLKSSIASSAEALTLPFFDDFSVLSVYPSPSRWIDSAAFVNTDYAKFPPSIGVATLDALNKQGNLYPGAGPYPFDADYLTSLPIRLDSIFTPEKNSAISRGDSIYFSFYYQPQGRTISPPSDQASLLLEFHSPGDNDTIDSENGPVITPRWRLKWATEGGVQVDTFAGLNKIFFRQVIIPITGITDSTLYYKNGFQFRFRNIAALAGNSQPDWRYNGSHWNIDVVYLNYGRKINDPFEDVAFGDPAPTMLVNYEAMPYRQYIKNWDNEMKDTLDIKIANLDSKNQNRTYKYNVKNSLSQDINYDGKPFTIEPYQTTGYVSYKPWANPPVNFFYSPTLNSKNPSYYITHTLTPDPNPLFRSNDTIRFTQIFSNYYAYDNGTSEAGIGINGAAGSYAIQFKLNEKDTLRGMQIYFNPLIGGTNQQIDLQVWNDSNGKPGQAIKTLAGVTPLYSGSLNEFTSYWFEEPLVVDASTFPGLIFYIGWTQSSVDNLNVGFDRYKDSQTRRFYNIIGNWEMSSDLNYYGSLMFRPIVGEENPLGVDKPSAVEHLSISPNPVMDGNLIIRLPETWTNNSDNKLSFSIITATGSLALSGTYHNPVNVSALAPGFYLVIVTNNSRQKATGKLIIR